MAIKFHLSLLLQSLHLGVNERLPFRTPCFDLKAVRHRKSAISLISLMQNLSLLSRIHLLCFTLWRDWLPSRKLRAKNTLCSLRVENPECEYE